MTAQRPLPQRATLRHELRPESTIRQHELYSSVTRRASHVQEQLLILLVEAARVGASEADVRLVRERLVAGHLGERDG